MGAQIIYDTTIPIDIRIFIDGLIFADDTSEALFHHTFHLFFRDERFPPLGKGTIDALYAAVKKVRYAEIKPLEIEFAKVGIIADCPIYQAACKFIESSGDKVPESDGFWKYFFSYSFSSTQKLGMPYRQLLIRMNKEDGLERIPFSTLKVIEDMTRKPYIGLAAVRRLLAPVLFSKNMDVNMKYFLLRAVEFQLIRWVAHEGTYSEDQLRLMFNANDMWQLGKFFVKLFNAPELFEARKKMGFYESPEKFVKKYSFTSLAFFELLIHNPEFLVLSMKKKGQDARGLPVFPEGYSFQLFLKYIPNGILMNLEPYIKTGMPVLMHLALGKSLREYPNLSIPLSKKMAHYCLGFMSDSNLETACKKAYLSAVCGSPKKDFTSTGFEDVDIRFFQGNYWKMVWSVLLEKEAQIDPLVSFATIFNYLDSEFGLCHFTKASAIGDAVDSFVVEELKRIKRDAWDFAKFKGYEVLCDEKEFYIIQLNSPKLLQDEGKVMNHCVATYTERCKVGIDSIWSLRKKGGRRDKRLATIQVNNRKKKIVQVKAKANGEPKSKHKDIIIEWSIVEDLDVAF